MTQGSYVANLVKVCDQMDARHVNVILYSVQCIALHWRDKNSKAVVAGTAMAVPIIRPTMYDQS